jgi:hypothetical protein
MMQTVEPAGYGVASFWCGIQVARIGPLIRRLVFAAFLLGPATGAIAADPAAGVGAAEVPAEPAEHSYGLDYEAVFLPGEGRVRMSVTLLQSRDLVRRVQFDFDPSRYSDFAADGELEVADNRVSWQPPAGGGALRFQVRLDHRRGQGGFDSRLANDWAVFRGDDLMPPVTVRTLKGASSRARLRLQGPEGWSFVTAYPRAEDDSDWYRVERADRRFDRPVGWMTAGRLGVRRDQIADRRVAVAGPTGQGVRHLDMLAFLRWNLPELVDVFPGFPERLLVVSAGDPMWRGGLSGPASLYIHAERPLISGNGTSTLLHELVHVAQGYRAARDEDWIVEGIAEYYTLEIMRRSGTISEPRYRLGFEKLEKWAARSAGLQSDASTGARTARSVMVMRDLDAELRDRSGGAYNLDDVARQLAVDDRPVSLERLRELAGTLAGGPVEALSEQRLGME